MLVTAAVKGDKDALEKQTSPKAGHPDAQRPFLLPAVLRSERSWNRLCWNQVPADNMAVAKMKCLRLLEAQVEEFFQHEDAHTSTEL